MHIRTNNKPRHTLDWYDLTPKERREFDYLDTDDKQQDATFVRYRRWVYDLHEFTRIAPPVAPHAQREGWERWHGYCSDSAFSGVLVRCVDNFESVVMGTYTS